MILLVMSALNSHEQHKGNEGHEGDVEVWRVEVLSGREETLNQAILWVPNILPLPILLREGKQDQPELVCHVRVAHVKVVLEHRHVDVPLDLFVQQKKRKQEKEETK